MEKVLKILADKGWKYSGKCNGWDQAVNTLTGEVIRIRVKSRLTINSKYLEYENLHIVFPVKRNWYLVKHGDLVETAGQHTRWLESKSWRLDGCYHTRSPSKKFLEMIESNKIGTEIS